MFHHMLVGGVWHLYLYGRLVARHTAEDFEEVKNSKRKIEKLLEELREYKV